MSKLSKIVKEQSNNKDKVVNFMGGISYLQNPLTTLKMVTASSIFGEPSYYRDSGMRNYDIYYGNGYEYLGEDMFLGNDLFLQDNKPTVDVMTESIDRALDYDYEGVLNWAVELRHTYNIRLNPQIIMVRAALHPDRKKYTDPTSEHKVDFRKINNTVMARADEPMIQMAYYLYLNDGKKNNIPSILKRSWADKLSSLNIYQVNKYKNAEIGMINGVRICHANSPVINELMKTGNVEVSENNNTWETLRSSGYSWKDIVNKIDIPYMALLRNLRGIFSEVNDVKVLDYVVDKLKSGVLHSKQFPFRFYSAYKALKYEAVYHKDLLLDALEDCIDIACDNMPKIKGKVMCLSDNSGSAWGTIPTEYGSVTIAEIDNLSSIITAKCADEGYVGVFGDKLEIVPISKHEKVLRKLEEVNTIGKNIGMATETGVWTFLYNAVRGNISYDVVFIYSDMQAGTGNLYGRSKETITYSKLGYNVGRFVNVYKLFNDYCKKVNGNVKLFSVQTAGYDNSILPQYMTNACMLYGWTGKESIFADIMLKIWNGKI